MNIPLLWMDFLSSRGYSQKTRLGRSGRPMIGRLRKWSEEGAPRIETHMLYVWYIYLHDWLSLFGQMLVNIPYMEHMGKAVE